jgi:hypothetical protein
MPLPSFGLEHARDPVDRDELHRLLDELLDLRERTDPNRRGDPADIRFRAVKGKDAAAGAAIATATQLYQCSAGWAVNHKIGRALTSEAAESPDSHAHEETGAAEYSFPNGGWPERRAETAQLDRAVMRAVLNVGFGFTQPILPVSLAREIIEALRALDFGETYPIFAPTNTGKHGLPFTLAGFRLTAVEYMHFLLGTGITRSNAETRAGGIFGVAAATIKSWERRLLPTLPIRFLPIPATFSVLPFPGIEPR